MELVSLLNNWIKYSIGFITMEAACTNPNCFRKAEGLDSPSQKVLLNFIKEILLPGTDQMEEVNFWW